MGRLELQSPAEVGRGIVQMSPFCLNRTDVQVGIGVPGPEADRLPEVGEGLFVPFLVLQQGKAQVVLGPVVAGGDLGRMAVEGDVVPPRSRLEPGQDRKRREAGSGNTDQRGFSGAPPGGQVGDSPRRS